MNEKPEVLVRLMYASRMAKTCSPADLQDILEVSRKNNAAMGVTGALLYSVRGFLQCMEGAPEPVNELYRRIVRDPRNESVSLISYTRTGQRCFPKWSMAYMREDQIDAALLASHGIHGPFDPFTLNAEQALGLTHDTAKERSAFLDSQQALH